MNNAATSSVGSLRDSALGPSGSLWKTSPEYRSDVDFESGKFHGVSSLLLTNPNFLSSHLFRADILYDSTSELETPREKEQSLVGYKVGTESTDAETTLPTSAVDVPGFDLKRTVVRRLIPRKPQMDRPIIQSCFFYDRVWKDARDAHLTVYVPHVSSEAELPFYHPPISAMGYLYESAHQASLGGKATLSVHVRLFNEQLASQLPSRYHRMFLSTLNTLHRLGRYTPQQNDPISKPPKDNLIPQHLTQNTYTRLKQKYAADLIARWVESTDPAKHVFEDLSIAAFLIEMWKQMYGVLPISERQKEADRNTFPGFVDMACGNGVLVFILIEEGYCGWGFDARQRKTWSTFPQKVQEKLEEMICIPKPFQDTMDAPDFDVKVHDGLFPSGTFIISNHADELTPWTPILAALADPERPLAYLAIPCCSHALDGSRYRYKPKKALGLGESDEDLDEDEQPKSGDLKQMRRAKKRGQGDPSSSTYASLTAYVVALASEIGYDVEKTLMRIPSTRNVGLIGRLASRQVSQSQVTSIVHRECEKSGGIDSAAKTWYARAASLQKGRTIHLAAHVS